MKKFKIALVEDNTMFANVVRVFLQGELDVEVKIFSSAESFLDSEISSFDLILLDYYLNISDFFAPSGEVVLNEMKSKGLNVPVILFSDLINREKINQLIGAGVVHFIPKTECLFEELLIVVQEALISHKEHKGVFININLN